ncbi:type II secretion system F family protein [Halalkalibacter urbisdiaboli]|uniref:type II secretion system F family protein n=1 Tax=Halalkalibacter urbisdiaboli TaxID=1960589 RepID=UPI000B4385A8|nr:type II secretion system F family protein [Halalkalibacter urbisdiaboli]
MLFLYKGIDAKTGKEIKGRMNAINQEAAAVELKGRGLYLTELKEQKASALYIDLNVTIGKPVKNKDFVIFCRQLATLIKSGTPIVDSIRILSDHVSAKPFKLALNDIYDDLRSGTAFSDACARFPKIFDKIFINMVRSGETSGDLENVLERMATFYEKDHKVKEKVKSALMYPLVVSIVAVVVVVILLTKVLPSLLNNLTSLGGEIPTPTKIVMAVSDFLVLQWYLVIFIIFAMMITFIAINKNPQGRFWLHMVKLKIPVFGMLIQKTLIARVMRTMSSMFKSSVPVLQTLTMSAEIANNDVIAKVLNEAKDSLRSGESLSAPLDKSWIFPKMVTHMIKVGEESGQLDTMLEKIADFYEDEVEQMASRLSTIIEPIMIAILGVIVGTIVLAAMLPMFEIYNQI